MLESRLNCVRNQRAVGVLLVLSALFMITVLTSVPIAQAWDVPPGTVWNSSYTSDFNGAYCGGTATISWEIVYYPNTGEYQLYWSASFAWIWHCIPGNYLGSAGGCWYNPGAPDYSPSSSGSGSSNTPSFTVNVSSSVSYTSQQCSGLNFQDSGSVSANIEV